MHFNRITLIILSAETKNTQFLYFLRLYDSKVSFEAWLDLTLKAGFHFVANSRSKIKIGWVVRVSAVFYPNRKLLVWTREEFLILESNFLMPCVKHPNVAIFDANDQWVIILRWCFYQIRNGLEVPNLETIGDNLPNLRFVYKSNNPEKQ